MTSSKGHSGCEFYIRVIFVLRKSEEEEIDKEEENLTRSGQIPM